MTGSWGAEPSRFPNDTRYRQSSYDTAPAAPPPPNPPARAGHGWFDPQKKKKAGGRGGGGAAKRRGGGVKKRIAPPPPSAPPEYHDPPTMSNEASPPDEAHGPARAKNYNDRTPLHLSVPELPCDEPACADCNPRPPASNERPDVNAIAKDWETKFNVFVHDFMETHKLHQNGTWESNSVIQTLKLEKDRCSRRVTIALKRDPTYGKGPETSPDLQIAARRKQRLEFRKKRVQKRTQDRKRRPKNGKKESGAPRIRQKKGLTAARKSRSKGNTRWDLAKVQLSPASEDGDTPTLEPIKGVRARRDLGPSSRAANGIMRIPKKASKKPTEDESKPVNFKTQAAALRSLENPTRAQIAELADLLYARGKDITQIYLHCQLPGKGYFRDALTHLLESLSLRPRWSAHLELARLFCYDPYDKNVQGGLDHVERAIEILGRCRSRENRSAWQALSKVLLDVLADVHRSIGRGEYIARSESFCEDVTHRAKSLLKSIDPVNAEKWAQNLVALEGSSAAPLKHTFSDSDTDGMDEGSVTTLQSPPPSSHDSPHSTEGTPAFTQAGSPKLPTPPLIDSTHLHPSPGDVKAAYVSPAATRKDDKAAPVVISLLSSSTSDNEPVMRRTDKAPTKSKAPQLPWRPSPNQGKKPPPPGPPPPPPGPPPGRSKSRRPLFRRVPEKTAASADGSTGKRGDNHGNILRKVVRVPSRTVLNSEGKTRGRPLIVRRSGAQTPSPISVPCPAPPGARRPGQPPRKKRRLFGRSKK